MAAGAMWAALRHSARVIAATNALGFAVTAVTQSHKVTDLCGTASFALSAWATHSAAARCVGGARAAGPWPSTRQLPTPRLGPGLARALGPALPAAHAGRPPSPSSSC